MSQLLSQEDLWNHWEGHRRVTLRTLEAFPEDQFHAKPVAGMRSFAELMTEIVNVEESTMNGLKTGEWKWEPTQEHFATKADLQKAFAQVRQNSQAIYNSLSIEKLQTVETDAWGMTSSNLFRIFYMIDNEIHHRGQTYVFLRLLGLEPPAFYIR